MTLVCVMIRNLWLVMATHRIFFKMLQCLNCNNSYNICPCIKFVKIECFLSSFQNRSGRENDKILLQNNCINIGVTNGLKQKKEKKHVKQLYMVK